MRFLKILTFASLVFLTVTARADEGEALAQDLSDLRRQMGSSHQADSDEFQRAVREVAKDRQERGPRSRDMRPTGPPPGYRRPPDFHHRPAPTPAPTPAMRLRETAFQLDRLAHELEMAELYEGADTLRETAKKLRQSARRVAVSSQDGSARVSPPRVE